ncbi:MAG: hypothetical protein HY682_11685 [Chloroflexi bacterium]|nr:hypothetical protein [Chloroflexota bacterium]
MRWTLSLALLVLLSLLGAAPVKTPQPDVAFGDDPVMRRMTWWYGRTSAPASAHKGGEPMTIALGLHMLRQPARRPSGNLLLSPSALWWITMTGFDGTIAEGQAFVGKLGLPGTIQQDTGCHVGFLVQLDRTFPPDADRRDMAIAASVWIRGDVDLSLVSLSYAYPYERIFTSREHCLKLRRFRQGRDSTSRIDRWATDATRGVVRSVVPRRRTFDQDIYAAAAAGLAGRWEADWGTRRTRSRSFHLSRGRSVAVPMSDITGSFRYAQAKGIRALRLPLDDSTFIKRGHGKLSLTILLPSATESFDLAIPGSVSDLSDLFKKMRATPIRASCPRIRMAHRADVLPALRALGLGAAFGPHGWYGGPDRKWNLAGAFHGTSIDISDPPMRGPVPKGENLKGRPSLRFDADRPFVFIVRDEETGLLPFVGIVRDPRSARSG